MDYFKLCDDVAGNLMRNFDIIPLCETWAGIEDEFVLDGYPYFNFPRRFHHKNAKHNSGGLGIFIRESIAGVYLVLKVTMTWWPGWNSIKTSLN